MNPAAPMQPFRVALVCMPFGVPTVLPSIQLGLLGAIAEQAGFPTDTCHLYLDLSARLTPPVYDALCNHRGHLTGEWLFSIAAFGSQDTDDAYFAAFPREVDWVKKKLGQDAAFLTLLRQEVLPTFIDDCLRQTDWGQYGVVGFSSTFQQNVASLALARRIKERYPDVAIVFGGANWEGDMGQEYFRAFPFVDYAVVGEGDQVFPDLLYRLSAGQRPENLPGLLARGDSGLLGKERAAPVQDLDALPTPRYAEFFARSRDLGLLREGEAVPDLPFESSRGCWWGQKHHCTFCGLNGHSMAFRAKSPERLVAELAELARVHGVASFQATDNILAPRYVAEVFAKLAATRTDYRFFYEVKANLTREQLRVLYQGGLRHLQPGIESLSSHVLRLMRKGATMLQNVRLLKWCRYYGIDVSWNLIWGFPGETAEDYQRELEVLRLIPHLSPPESCYRIWLERFAPYFFDRDRFPIHAVRPEASYSHVYPAHVQLEKVAYFFDYRMDDTLPAEVHRETQEWLQEWKQRWTAGKPDTLVYRRTPDAVAIDDRRGPGKAKRYTIHGFGALAYEHCSETMRTAAQVTQHLQASPAAWGLSAEAVGATLEQFCRKGLMVSEEGQYLSLALPVNPNW